MPLFHECCLYVLKVSEGEKSTLLCSDDSCSWTHRTWEIPNLRYAILLPGLFHGRRVTDHVSDFPFYDLPKPIWNQHKLGFQLCSTVLDLCEDFKLWSMPPNVFYWNINFQKFGGFVQENLWALPGWGGWPDQQCQ